MHLSTGYPLKTAHSRVFSVLLWGALWGIFESTAGYVLHLLPVSAGWLVWYPAACFFMACAWHQTRKASSILYVAVLAAAIKMLDLLLPGRIDRVINPAFSILFEGATLYLAVIVVQKLPERIKNSAAAKALSSIGMNTAWRILYIMYILFFVPQWIRDVSVISSRQTLIRFLLTDNLATSAILFAGTLLAKPFFKHLQSPFAKQASNQITPKVFTLALLLGADVLLQILL